MEINDGTRTSNVSYEAYKERLNRLSPGLGIETPDYNLKGAYEGKLIPQLSSDGRYHLGSRNPNTGEILKKPGHETWDLMLEEEKKAGYEVYEKDGKWFSKKIENNQTQALPKDSDYTEDGTLIEKIKGSKLNPKNWGVLDYSDKGDFSTAFAAARKSGEKAFMWNNTRFPTTKKNLPGERIKERDDFKGTIFTSSEKNAKRHGDLFNYYKGEPLTANTHNLQVSKYRPDDETDPNSKYISIQNDEFKDAVVYYLNNHYKETGKSNRADYFLTPEGKYDKNLRPFVDLGSFKIKRLSDSRGDYVQYYDIWDYSRNNAPDVNKTDNLGLTKPFEVYDRIYTKDYGDGKQKRMYYSDKELPELDVNKKDFDTLALQRELSNRGYELPNSTKKDGTLDGILGDETKNALLDYQTKNKTK